MRYQVGDSIRLQATLRDVSGAVADGTVTFRVETPAGVKSSYTTSTGVVRDAVGVYHYDLELSATGKWWWGFASTGSVVAVSPDRSFYVEASRFT